MQMMGSAQNPCSYASCVIAALFVLLRARAHVLFMLVGYAAPAEA